MKTVVQGIALEVAQKRDKNDNAKVYNTLIVYEFGKMYPELLRMSVNAEKLQEAVKLPGHIVEVEGEVIIFKDRTSVQFVTGRIIEQKKAA